MAGEDREKTNGLEVTSIGAGACAEEDAQPETQGVRQAPPYPEIAWGPLPGGGFRFSDHPTAEEFSAYAKWDPNIKEEVEEKFRDLAQRRARDDAIRDVYARVQPDPPDLPRETTPRTPGETALALARFVTDTQEAVDHLLAIGRTRYNDHGLRVQALTAVTRVGHAAAQLGDSLDRLFRPSVAPRGRRRTRKDAEP